MSHCKYVIYLITVGFVIAVRLFELTNDRRMRVSLHLALFSANSRLLMSFRRILYLFICSQMISSTHLWWDSKDKTTYYGLEIPNNVITK